MTTIITGDPSTVTTPLTRSVAGCANNGAGLVRVQTTASHLFSTADVVVIENVTGTTEANGTWSIIVIDATHFDLVGSVFSNAYVSGGAVQDTSLTPPMTTPSDGESCTAESLKVDLQCLADRTQYLNQLARVAARYVVSDAALLSLTLHSNGDVVWVKDVGPYLYDTTSAATAATPFVRTPSDVSGSGRWILADYGALNVANGLPQLDASARLAVGLERLAPVAFGQYTSVAQTFTSGTLTLLGAGFSPNNVAGVGSFNNGDVIAITSSVRMSSDSGTSMVSYLAVSENGGAYNKIDATLVLTATTGVGDIRQQSQTAFYVCAHAGTGFTISVGILAAINSGTNGYTFAGTGNIIATVYRP